MVWYLFPDAVALPTQVRCIILLFFSWEGRRGTAGNSFHMCLNDYSGLLED